MTFRLSFNLLATTLAALTLLGCGGGGGSGLIPPPLAVEATSYGNKNTISFDQPQLTGVTSSIASSLTLGDFAQEGAYSAFVAVGQLSGPPTARFYRRSGGGWAEIANLIKGDNSVCTNIIQAVTADFNGDAKPDVYVVCGGNAKQVFFMSQGKEYVRQESSFTLTDSWGAAAGDIDGDGDIDLVLTDNGFTYAYMNDGQKLGAASFGSSPSAGRIPTSAAGVDFPTRHRKVFLLPRIGKGPDLVIGGDGASNNKTMILLKNDNGSFFANPNSSSTFNTFEGHTINNVALKPLDLVETSRFLYVLSRDADISSAVTAQTNLLVLRYELPANNNPAVSVINFVGADGLNTTNEASFAVFKQTAAPSDGYVAQFKPVNGKLVAYDGACADLLNRCAFNVTAP